MKYQKDYSECIRLMYDFKRQYGENYGNEFTNLLESRKAGPLDPQQFDPINTVNSCRSITINYWREVVVFKKSFPGFVKKQDLLKTWKYKHIRFVNLVELLDQLSHYTEEEKLEVYNRHLFNEDVQQ